ncbi:putative vacuole morphology and inheritance protein [Clavispora lusitaniae]|uniref:Vacuole morphology and inheritance protein n=1 Tax=Clavispora lusitaniae TaxID=36911 RepID=A0AA91PYA0_CLALS|nr:hypothetical protein E0198_002182 [Clavispora lusitaniae]OVF07560.1 putative vacuole morphology and inheritance protein [Clavispora lusitaniae]
MSEPRILDQAIVKDLSNHIYEKRKATAFQIESVTKAALSQNDSATIYKIIAELTELANSGSTPAKMGAITALGSVSVALGSFAIAYFLEDIVKPIFATFRDTDARVRYYACESLYNIAKIARGEILLYFNEVFDILCILVTDTESSVKNAADILDRLIKDIVSAKSTIYVSILHQQNRENEIRSNVVGDDGMSVQVNEIQDPMKAFSLPKFIPTLLERMYTVEPFSKKFLLSWLELFDDIPSSELITFLPNFLEPLFRFLMNNCPSDVRIETQNLLNIFLKEIKAIYKVRYEVKKVQIVSERKRKWAEAQATSQESAQADSPEDEAITQDLENLSVKSGNSPNIDDSASIKSCSTTIIRKSDNEKSSVRDQSEVYDEGDSSLFINGQDIFIDYSRIIDILLSFLRTGVPRANNSGTKFNDLAGESHDIYLEIQSTVLKWLQEIITISPVSFSKYLPDCVSIIVQNVALTDDNNDTDLRNQFLSFNKSLQLFLERLNEGGVADEGSSENLSSPPEYEVSESTIQGLNKEAYDEFLELYLNSTLQVVMAECMLSINELARLTSLDWLTFLYSSYPTSFFIPDSSKTDDTSPPSNKYTFDLTSLLRSFADASHDVISKVLNLASRISEDNQDFFKDFMIKLILFFEADGAEGNRTVNVGSAGGSQTLSRSKIEFIIRRLSVTISSEKIFKTLSEVLVSLKQKNIEFISNIVVTINNILLTSHELQDLRKKLKNLDIYKTEDWNLFSTLFQSWCYNVPSALSLCLLTSNYELAYSIIKNLAESEVTFQLLTQLDVLVQLLESHIFLKLRLQLLEPDKHPYLYKTLYGILMIMPQSSTYNTLKNRLAALANFHHSGSGLPVPIVPVSTPSTVGASSSTSTTSAQLSTKRKRINELAEKFARVNDMHDTYINEARQREALSDELSKSSIKAGKITSQAGSDRHGTDNGVRGYATSTHRVPTASIHDNGSSILHP